MQYRSSEEYSGLECSMGLSCVLLILYFFISRSETLLAFVKFWLHQALLHVYCLALLELGDFHKSVLDWLLKNNTSFNSDLVFVISWIFWPLGLPTSLSMVFLIPEVGETSVDFINFWLSRAFFCVDCLAMPGDGDLHKFVWDWYLKNAFSYKADPVLDTREIFWP